jgi:hypothetical protein
MKSNREYSIAFSTNNTTGIAKVRNNVNTLLTNEPNNLLQDTCREYTDDILDLRIGECIYLVVGDNEGDMLIKRLK